MIDRIAGVCLPQQPTTAPDPVMKVTIAVITCLLATGCATLGDFFEEEPKTCEETCEDVYIGCLEWAYDTVTETSVQQGPYNPRRYPPQQTTTTTTTRQVPSRAEEERCRLDFERCQRGCVAAEDGASALGNPQQQ